MYDVKLRINGGERTYKTNVSKRDAKALVKELRKKDFVAFFVSAKGENVALVKESELPYYESESD